jgi:transcriptional regulator with XRE-family HTH domain
LRWHTGSDRTSRDLAGISDKEVGRRVRAARAYKGITSVPALAEAINEPGMRVTTLYAIEQGKRHAPPRELAAIARACDLPAAFFEIDFRAIRPQPNDLETRLADLENKVAEARLDSLADDLAILRRRVEERAGEDPPQ